MTVPSVASLLNQPHVLPASTPLRPYSQVKSPRGPLREKWIATAGFAVPNSDWLYFGITDDQIQPLVGCGGHGRQEYIQDLKCQACQTKFSVRYGTVLYRLKTPARRVGEVLSALAEGLSVGAAARRLRQRVVRVFGHGERSEPASRDTRRTARRLMPERLFQDLTLLHVQLDAAKPSASIPAKGMTLCGFGSSSTLAPKSSPCCKLGRALNQPAPRTAA